MNGPKIYFTIPLFGGIGITQTTVSSFVVMLLLCIAAVVLGSNLQKRPSRRQVLVEKGVTMLYDMVESTMGKHNSYWTPYIGALFLSSVHTQMLARNSFGIRSAVNRALSLSGVPRAPYLEVGVPGILSLYFDIFSGGVQALVFSLLTMVYVGNACPPPEKA